MRNSTAFFEPCRGPLEQRHSERWLTSFRTWALAGSLMCAAVFPAHAIDIAGWTCEGNCGVLGADGDVTLAPGSSGPYGWVSNNNGVLGLGLTNDGRAGFVGPSDGSRLLSPVFAANAGAQLRFYFNFVTADGDVFSDYAWARLLDQNDQEVAVLFSARSTDDTQVPTVPGAGMPAPTATLSPATALIQSNPNPLLGPSWSPLGSNSGDCWRDGCGYTGWVQATYSIPANGSYRLELGVVNWNLYDVPPTDLDFDTLFDSGLAFDVVTLDNVPLGAPPSGGSQIAAIPTLGTWGLGLLSLALGWLGSRRMARRS